MTTLSDRTGSLNDPGTVNNPILHNIQHCQFDDPMYDNISHDSVALQPSTPSKPSLRFSSESNQMDVDLTAMDNNTELQLNHMQQRTVTPIHLIFMGNEDVHEPLKDSNVDILLFDDQTYAQKFPYFRYPSTQFVDIMLTVY